jgi:hypothetical protein
MYHRHKLLDLIYITSMDLVYVQSLGNLNDSRFNHLHFAHEMQDSGYYSQKLHRSRKETLRASKDLLRNRIQFHSFQMVTMNKQMGDLETFPGDQ